MVEHAQIITLVVIHAHVLMAIRVQIVNMVIKSLLKIENRKKTRLKLVLFSKITFNVKKGLPCVLSSPCYNGATCTDNSVGGYTCTCAIGYTGTNCAQYGIFVFFINKGNY